MTLVKQQVLTSDSATTTSIQIAKNTIVVNVLSNVLLIGMNAGVSLLLAPYLIHRLGVAAYGMVALANSFPSYILIVSTSITNTVLRFVTIEIVQNRVDQANLYFNTAFKAIVAINGVLFLPAMLFAFSFSNFLVVPSGMEWQCSILVALIFISGLLSALVSTIQVIYPLFHKFYLQNMLLAIARMAGVVVLIGCFLAFGAKLIFVGLYQLVFSIIGFVLIFTVQFHFQNTLRLHRGLFHFQALSEMMRMSLWVLISDLSALLYLSAGLVVINKTLGAEATGQFGPIMLIISLLVMLAGAVGNVLLPIFYAFIGKDDNVLSEKLLQAMRIIGFLLGAPVIVLCGFAKPIFSLWLGNSFVELWPLLWLVALSMWAGGICFIHFGYVFMGMNRVKIPAVVNLVFGVLHIITTIVLIKYLGLGLISFGISFVIYYGIRGVLFNSIYASALLKRPYWYFIRPLATIFLAIVAFSIVGNILSSGEVGCFGLVSIFLLLCSAYVAYGYLIVISKRDRQLLAELFFKRR